MTDDNKLGDHHTEFSRTEKAVLWIAGACLVAFLTLAGFGAEDAQAKVHKAKPAWHRCYTPHTKGVARRKCVIRSIFGPEASATALAVAKKETRFRLAVCDYKWGTHCGIAQLGVAERKQCGTYDRLDHSTNDKGYNPKFRKWKHSLVEQVKAFHCLYSQRGWQPWGL